MTPTVLIATHNRVEITTKNVKSLLRQSVVPNVVLVVSKDSEKKYFDDTFVDIETVMYYNEPLGKKWQFGVEMCQLLFQDSPIIITGSDDILGKGFIEQACSFIEDGFDFVGMKRWYVHDCKRNKVHLFDYKASLPLGGGRIYSAEFLHRVKHKIFESSKERLLDDYGWHQVKQHSKKMLIENERLKILSVKGDWPMMNPMDKMMAHKNAQLLKTLNVDEILNQFL